MNPSRRRYLIIGVVIIGIVTAYQIIMPHLRNDNGWPNWNGIKPGITRPWQVQGVVGEPSYFELCPYNYANDYYPIGVTQKQRADWLLCFRSPLGFAYQLTDSKLYDAEVVTTLSTVRYVVEDLLSNKSDFMLSDLILEKGVPDRIEWSRRSHDYRVVLYCERGLGAHVTRYQVASIIYFVPRPESACSSIPDLRAEMASDNPFVNPEQPAPESLDIWGTGWSREVIEKMGQ